MNGYIMGQFAFVALLIAVCLLIYHLKRRWRRRHWIPVTGTISTYKTATSSYYDTPDQLLAAVTYTYRVRDQMYWGEFQEIVEDERAAQRVFDQFPKGSPIALLYDPKRPAMSCRLAHP